MHPDVRPIESLVPRRATAFGGKARSLAELVRAGFVVPAGFAISASVAERAMAAALPQEDRLEALLVAPARALGETRLHAIAEAVRTIAIPEPAERAIREAYTLLAREGAPRVAVRSSALSEDHATRSSAGLYATRLDVVGEEAVLEAIRAVWASAFSSRVITYLRSVGGDPSRAQVGIGVVVQALLSADVSGVLFTVNPLSGDPQEIVVNASFGLGELVVDGSVTPDTYRIDKGSGFLRDHVVGEKARARFVRERGLVDERVPEPMRRRSALEPDEVRSLTELARRIERTFGDARDVEWAIAEGTLYTLQARPVTALAARAPVVRRPRDRARIVWSTINVGEALPGVATPLTWSVLSGFSDVGFRRAFGAIGCRVPPDAELVGNFRGRIYLNLSDFFAIASEVPGLAPDTILALGGGGIDALASASLGREPTGRSSAAWLARLPLTAARFTRENLGSSRRVARFEERFEEERARLEALDLRLLSSTAVHRVLLEVERLLDQSGQVLLNVYGNLLASTIALRALVSTRGAAHDDALLRDLLSGLADVDSAEPGLELARIAESARRDAAARGYIEATEPEHARVEALPDGPTRRLLEDFLRRYGDRGTREAELSEPRWREDPTLPFATLRLHLQREASAVSSAEHRRRAVVARFEEAFATRVPRVLRPLLRRGLDGVRALLRTRERLRSRVVTVLGFFRVVALDASRRMRAMEPGVGDDGAFYLSLEELHGVLRGDVVGVGDLVRVRRLQLARDAALPAPPATFVGFPPVVSPPDPSVRELVGIGASAGRATGLVRWLREPKDASAFRPGEILLARQTDVGWSPLFLAASGVVTELGGPLSHASIVAREFGVPAVVDVANATEVLRTGDRVEIDGTRGTVRLLERA